VSKIKKMKKILFIAFAFAAFSNLASAQAKANTTMTPAPSKEQLEKDNSTKAASVEQLNAPAPSRTTTDADMANYKKAGLNQAQIANVEKSMAELDQRKAEIEGNSNLTAEQKKNGIAAIETERNAVLRKSMGEDGYKRYTIVTQNSSQSKAKPAKKATN
jgi:hypothetical protein